MHSNPTLSRFQAAEMHTKRVRQLRIALPIMALLLIIASIVAVIVVRSQSAGISYESLGLENGRIVMANPQVSGTAAEGQLYEVTAQRATQDPLVPMVIDLEEILANVPTGRGGLGLLTAVFGQYDSNAQSLHLKNNIAFEVEDGSSLALEEARIDMKNGTMESNMPVTVVHRGATLKAEGGVRVTDGGNAIHLFGGVSATIPPQLLNDIEPSN